MLPTTLPELFSIVFFNSSLEYPENVPLTTKLNPSKRFDSNVSSISNLTPLDFNLSISAIFSPLAKYPTTLSAITAPTSSKETNCSKSAFIKASIVL